MVASAVMAAATIGGSLLASSSAKKSANKAADTSLAVAEKNNALARDIYDQNKGALSPYMTRGNQAGDAIMELLGFDRPPAPANNPQTGALAQYAPQQLGPQQYGQPGALGFAGGEDMRLGPIAGVLARRGLLGQPSATPPFNPYAPPAGTVTTPAPQQQPPQTAKSAFDRYRESTGYQFRLGQGYDAINTGYAARGLLESGAAQKALLRYGQDFGSGEFGNYLGYLTNQQGMGLSGASALAGVGQNYAGMVTANNNMAGSAAANAALVKGSANAQMWQGIGGALGNVLGSSYGGWR